MSERLIVNDSDKKFRRCSRCGKEFATRRAADQHIVTKHKGKGERVHVKVRDDEPSMAELLIEAEIARACGEPVDEYLLEMLP